MLASVRGSRTANVLVSASKLTRQVMRARNMSDTEKALRLLDQQVGGLKGMPKKISKDEVWASFLKEIE